MMLALFVCDPKNVECLQVDFSDANAALLINCLTVDNRRFLVGCQNGSHFFIKNENDTLDEAPSRKSNCNL